jgi:uncharacterized protein (TIGR02996 family)
MPKRAKALEDGFRQALRKNPADVATRSAYADWLMEQGKKRAGALQKRKAAQWQQFNAKFKYGPPLRQFQAEYDLLYNGFVVLLHGADIEGGYLVEVAALQDWLRTSSKDRDADHFWEWVEHAQLALDADLALAVFAAGKGPLYYRCGDWEAGSPWDGTLVRQISPEFFMQWPRDKAVTGGRYIWSADDFDGAVGDASIMDRVTLEDWRDGYLYNMPDDAAITTRHFFARQDKIMSAFLSQLGLRDPGWNTP